MLPTVYTPSFSEWQVGPARWQDFSGRVAGKLRADGRIDTVFTIDTSGILTMDYDGFVSTSAGAKDSWGVNYFQIEGEQGYIYVPHGSNGLVRIKVVTKNGEEVFNEQSDPDRWFYEVQNMTRLLLAGDREAIEQRLETMLDVIETIETARKEAGIFFPGDEIDEHPFI